MAWGVGDSLCLFLVWVSWVWVCKAIDIDVVLRCSWPAKTPRSLPQGFKATF